MGRKKIVVGLGELLWDLFPSGKQLGGAPANFAYITSLLGDTGIPASCVGDDLLGSEALQRLGQLGLRTDFVQQDRGHPTGTVNVLMNGQMNDGQHRFEIRENVAWDFLQWTEDWARLADEADAVCFGSLAQRSSTSRTTILRFLRATRAEAVRVFDVNLRQNFYSKETIDQSMKLATIVKLNHEELPKIMRMFEIEVSSEQDTARKLLALYGVKVVCITRGAAGSLLVSTEECCQHPGFKVKIADTVGAGDAFTAALVHGYLRGMILPEINEKANRVGAWVAGQSGAMPNVDRETLPQILKDIS
ncbi:MAG: carbohydrate kinase [Candidatus Sulfotelmatobacter sp.]